MLSNKFFDKECPRLPLRSLTVKAQAKAQLKANCKGIALTETIDASARLDFVTNAFPQFRPSLTDDDASTTTKKTQQWSTHRP
jgi:hypothetical protein